MRTAAMMKNWLLEKDLRSAATEIVRLRGEVEMYWNMLKTPTPDLAAEIRAAGSALSAADQAKEVKWHLDKMRGG